MMWEDPWCYKIQYYLGTSLQPEKKLTAESILEEVKTTLGWILDTHWLIIGLTLDQFFIRTASIIL
jgi:hypothetical protein